LAQYFLGRYEYAMDDRGRVPIPPRYRDLFAHGAMLNQGPDPCLRFFTAESFAQQAQLYTSEPAIERSGRMTRHAFFANSFSVELDKQSRILIPAPLRAYARLEGNVIIAGAGEWLEIWNPEQFEAEMAAADRWQNRSTSQDATP
jgi:MraZ protein